MKRGKYRIVTDEYLGYEVQIRTFKFWWIQCSEDRHRFGINTFTSVDEAEEFINQIKNKNKKKGSG